MLANVIMLVIIVMLASAVMLVLVIIIAAAAEFRFVLCIYNI